VQPGVRGAQGAAQRDGQERRRQAQTPPTLGDSENPGQGRLYRGTHCKENPISVFLFWELRSLNPNFHIHVSVSDLYIPRIGPHIWLQQNRQTDPGNI
jgi:hypothetical protein